MPARKVDNQAGPSIQCGGRQYFATLLNPEPSSLDGYRPLDLKGCVLHYYSMDGDLNDKPTAMQPWLEAKVEQQYTGPDRLLRIRLQHRYQP